MASEYLYKLLEPWGVDCSPRGKRTWRYNASHSSTITSLNQSKTMAQFLAADFLLPADGSNPEVSAGDIIFANCSDGTVLARVSAASTSAVTLQRIVSHELSGTATWDPASLASGQRELKAITVTGAEIGDTVKIAPPVDLQGLMISASVIAADTVEVALFNAGTILAGSATHDFSSIDDGNEEAVEITVTGAALGDPVTVISPSIDLTDIALVASVTAADTVTVVALNNTGGAIDLGSQTLLVRVADESANVDLASGTWTAYVEKR